MPAKSATFDNDFLKLIFNATPISGLALNDSSGTNLYVSLHTASPLSNGTQTTYEATYESYQRVSVARTTSGWTVLNSSVSPAATITFPTCTGGYESITHFAVGTSATGSGKILYFGSLTPAISISSSVTAQITTASTITEQ
jgi:hypothetical protein